jgi:hypothetical protein
MNKQEKRLLMKAARVRKNHFGSNTIDIIFRVPTPGCFWLNAPDCRIALMFPRPKPTIS